MERYEEEAEDSDNETDPEQLLNEWLGELDSLTVVSFIIFPRIVFFSLAILRSRAVDNSVWTARLFVRQINIICRTYVRWF